MKRGYTVLEYKSLVRKLRAARPDLSLSSDFIIGFPGETDDDFEKTMKLVDELGFDNSFSFVYSARPGTPAADMADDTPPAVKQEAADAPAETHREQRRPSDQPGHGRQRAARAGRRPSRKDASELAGRTDNNRVVNFAGRRA
jgi:tRNA-2-methylthio-N6-dimethylallyladenosine synthase